MSGQRIVLMSLKEKPYRDIVCGRKLYEFRTRYTRDESVAFIYVTRDVKAVCGLVFFDRPIVGTDQEIAGLSENMNPGSYSYMMDYFSKGTGFAIPVKKVLEITPVPLEQIRQEVDGFVVPQSWYYLDTEGKENLLQVLKEKGEIDFL